VANRVAAKASRNACARTKTVAHTMYFVVHPHGQQMVGRWVGLSYDGKVITGWAAMTHDEDQARGLVGQLRDGAAVPA
jgi:hypothetical protein